jgi:hypothetical protein
LSAPDDESEEAESAGNPVGRPTDYQFEFCQIAADLCVGGATDFEVAERLGVSVRTIYRWQAEHPEFRQSLRVGKELSDDRVESSLYHRAVGYTHNAVKIMQNNGVPLIIPYVEHVAPDTGAAIHWLANRRGDKWRSKQQVELTGANGGPIETRNADSLTDAELETLARAGRAAPAEPEKGAE